MSVTVIKVEGLYKKFTTSLKRSMLYGTYDAMRDMAGITYDATHLRKKEFWALKDISFELKRGESLGIIGQNGCGKTTLLRLINGIFPPDKGKITINGRIGALIAVGAGFHPHMTGRENIFLNGTILGMTKQEIRSKFDEIVDFAEIGEFLDAPVATYSSGMTVRLGFSIAIHCEPDILLLDEILAVGDSRFQLKCMDKILEMCNRDNISLLFVSHNTTQMTRLCQNAILLNYGKQIYIGTSTEAAAFYIKMLNTLPESASSVYNKQNSICDIKIIKVRCYSSDDSDIILYKDNFSIEIIFKTLTFVKNAELRLAFSYPNKSQYLSFINSHVVYEDWFDIKEGTYRIKFNIYEPNLLPNEYAIHFSLANRENIYLFGQFDICRLKILNNPRFPLLIDDYSGVVKLNSESKIELYN